MTSHEIQQSTPALIPTERDRPAPRREHELASSLADALADILRSERDRGRRGAS